MAASLLSAGSADESTNLLITEYERSSEFCNHVDDVRNVITSFFLTVAGGAVFAIDRYTSGQIRGHSLGSPTARVTYLLAGVAVIGVLFVMTIARLRRIQTERYKIMNDILDAVLTSPHRALVPFQNDQIPGLTTSDGPFNRRLAGSYIWTLILVIPTAAVAAIATFLALRAAARGQPDLANALGPVIGVATVVGCDWIFWRLSAV